MISKRLKSKSFKIVYIAPIKALCQEKYNDWKFKFSLYGLTVIEATGDSDYVNLVQLTNANIIVTTPERWDSITRRWQEFPHILIELKLVLIDEVHLLNEETRGATLEAIVARMKLISQLQGKEGKLI